MWRWTANSLGQVRREKCISSFLFTSSIKHEIKYFHVVVLQKRQRNVQKSVMNVQSLSNLLHFWHSPAVDVADRKALIKNIISRKIDPLFASLGDNYGIYIENLRQCTVIVFQVIFLFVTLRFSIFNQRIKEAIRIWCLHPFLVFGKK